VGLSIHNPLFHPRGGFKEPVDVEHISASYLLSFAIETTLSPLHNGDNVGNNHLNLDPRTCVLFLVMTTGTGKI